MTTERDQRRQRLAAMPDAELRAACVTAIQYTREPGGSSGDHWHFREDCWAACCDSNREELFREALRQVRAAAQARFEAQRKAFADVGRKS